MTGTDPLPRVPTRIYRANPALNWSTLKAWRVSPLHGQYLETTGETDADNNDLLLGRAFHVATLEPDTFNFRFAKWTSGRRAGAAWDDFCEEHAAQEILTASQWDTVHGMAAAVRSHPAAARYFEDLRVVEAVREWTDAPTKTKCKARLDAVPFPAVVLDLKSARTIIPRAFAAEAWRRGYFHQGAFYRRAQAAHLQRNRDLVQYILIAVEKVAPFDVCVMPVSPATLDECDIQIDALLKLRAECKASGVYPGAYPEPVEIGAPAWAIEIEGDGFEIVTQED